MKIAAFCLLTTILNCAVGQNPFWVHMDKKIIQGIALLDKTKPIEIEQYFVKQRKETPIKHNLGFGWSSWTTTLYGGYTSLQGTFYYYNDTIESYSLTSRLPGKSNLRDKYTKWFGSDFALGPRANVSYDFKADRLTKPLSAYNGNLKLDSVSSKVLIYMSPRSGIMYGYSGGLPITLLQNRQSFNAIKDSLNLEESYLLMFSINPASRLTAIEHFRRHPDRFENKEQIEKWISIVYREVPFVSTLMGCLGEIWNSKELVDFCVKIQE